MITLTYDTRIYVEVDVDEERVARVTVSDEAAEIDRAGSLLMQNVDPDVAQGQYGQVVASVDRAIEIAESRRWPAWEFGF